MDCTVYVNKSIHIFLVKYSIFRVNMEAGL